MSCRAKKTSATKIPKQLRECLKILGIPLPKYNPKKDKTKNEEEIEEEYKNRVKQIVDPIIDAITRISQDVGVDPSYAERIRRLSEELDNAGKEVRRLTNARRQTEGEVKILKENVEKNEFEIDRLKEEKENKDEQNQALVREVERLTKSNDENADENKSLKDQLNRLKVENRVNTEIKQTLDAETGLLKKSNEQNAYEIERLKEQLNRLADELRTSRDEYQFLVNEKQAKDDENTALKLESEDLKVYAENLKREFKKHQEEAKTIIKSLQHELHQLQQTAVHLQQQETQSRTTIDHLQSNVMAERKAKEDALTRLSAAAASKLRDKNPGITDLSDPNRPLKLSEKMSELYDNEWTNAMEKLEDLGIDENEGIEIMLNIVTTVFDHFRHLGQRQLENISKVVVVPHFDGEMNEENYLDKIPELPIEILKPLKDFRKAHADIAIRRLQQTFAKDCLADKVDSKCLESCSEYIASCTELVWLMQVQDPPVHIEWGINPDDDFDTNTMRSYTKSGKYVDYVVWPILYLHKGGPLLCKGVVQGKKTKKTKEEAQAEGQNKPFDDKEPTSKKTNTETEVDGTNIQNGNDIHDQSNHIDPSNSSQMNLVEPPRSNGNESTAAQTNEANHTSEDSQGENGSKSDPSISSNGEEKEEDPSHPIPHSTEAAEQSNKEREESHEEESESSHSLNEEKDGDTPSDTSTTHEAATGTTAGETCEEGRERSMPHSTEAAEPSNKEREESPEKESESSHSLIEEKDGDTPSDTPPLTHEAATGTTVDEAYEEGRERTKSSGQSSQGSDNREYFDAVDKPYEPEEKYSDCHSDVPYTTDRKKTNYEEELD